MALEFGFMIQPRSLEETHELAREADTGGYAWVGIADSPAVYQDSYLHQYEALQATRRVRVGPLVSHVVLRHPLILGNLLATLHERYGARSVGVIGTGNSAARGVGASPTSLRDLAEALDCIRGYWAGHGGTFRGTSVPATGLRRHSCPLMIAGDGPKVAELAGHAADGFFYGGVLEPSVLQARLSVGCRRPGQAAWVGPIPVLAERLDDVLQETGPQLVAMANRALRGNLAERGVPKDLHDDVRQLWRTYDYAYHADSRRPRNLDYLSPRLATYMVDRLAVWGDESRWRARLDALGSVGCGGVMFILGHDNPLSAVRHITARLQRLGYLARGYQSEPGMGTL